MCAEPVRPARRQVPTERVLLSEETPAELWRAAVAPNPARPFVTSYGATPADRVELSYASLDNWVSKTANMLLDGLGAEPGNRVALALPLHWQSLAWLFACWSTGMVAVPATDEEIPEADIAVAAPDRLEAALATSATEVVGASLHPLGAPMVDPPATVTDYTVEVRGFGDRFDPPTRVPADAPALAVDVPRDGGELVSLARRRATKWGLSSDDRVAVAAAESAPLTAPGADLGWLLAPVLRGAALMITSYTDSVTMARRLETERVTATVGLEPAALPSTAAVRTLT